MKQQEISKFQASIDRINVLYGLILPVSLMTIIAIATWFIWPDYFRSGSLFIYIFVIVSVSTVFAAHFKHLNHLTKNQLTFMYSYYHVALIIFSLFVAPPRSPYDFLWVILAAGMDMVFKKRWIYLTLVIYMLTITVATLTSDIPLTKEQGLLNLLQFIGVVTASYLVSRYRRISDAEMQALDISSKNSTFERQRLLSLINNMSEAMVATDENGKVLLYNAGVLNLLDTNASLDKKNIDKILNLKDTQYKSVRLLEQIKAKSVGFSSTDFLHHFSKEDAINLYINVSPIKLGFKEDAESGYIILLRDITKEKSLEEERDEFISVVSHELRTPVAIAEGNISNALYVSEKNHDPRQVIGSLNQAHEQVVFLANMINDLATLSRAERTDIKLELSKIMPDEFLESLASDYKPQAEKKKLQISFTCAENTKPIMTSELYLREVMQNFITNAIKYTKKGSVLLHVRTNKTGDAVFSVADTGIGLSKADQKRVFDKFFRSEDFRTRESSGTGLGLYVTSKLAHRLQAQIQLSSELNKGTTFTITVPSLK